MPENRHATPPITDEKTTRKRRGRRPENRAITGRVRADDVHLSHPTRRTCYPLNRHQVVVSADTLRGGSVEWTPFE